MAANPIYIDSDEEILELVDRLRATDADEVPLVFPGRSRLGSRFNLQLLRQYALRLNKHVTIISADPGLKNLARDNGFSTYSGLEEYGAPPAFVPATPGVPLEFAVSEFAPRPVESSPLGSWAPPAGDPPPPATPRPAPVAAVAGRPLPAYPSNKITLSEAAGRDWALPNVGLRALRNRALYGTAAVLLLLGLFLMLLYVPSATVTIAAQARPFAAQADVTGVPGGGPVHVRDATSTKNAEQTFQPTGVKDTPAQASTGSVTYNNQCGAGLQIKQGQKLNDGNGHEFLQQSTVTVDSNSTASATVTAAKPGAAGNVAQGAITTIEFSADEQQMFGGCLTVTNPSALTGGTDEKKQAQVTQQDLDNARAQLQKQLQGSVHDDLSRQVQSGETLSDNVTYRVADFSADHQPNDTVNSFHASMSLQGRAVLYQGSDVSKALTENLGNHLPAGYALTDAAVKVDYKVLSVTPDGHVTFRGTASGFIAPKLDYAKIQATLAGHSPDAGKRFLATLPVRSSAIVQHPFGLPFLPFLGSRIDVKYLVEPAQPH